MSLTESEWAFINKDLRRVLDTWQLIDMESSASQPRAQKA
jgi:hypothetical protein